MSIYVFFPVALFYYFNRPDFYQRTVADKKVRVLTSISVCYLVGVNHDVLLFTSTENYFPGRQCKSFMINHDRHVIDTSHDPVCVVIMTTCLSCDFHPSTHPYLLRRITH